MRVWGLGFRVQGLGFQKLVGGPRRIYSVEQGLGRGMGGCIGERKGLGFSRVPIMSIRIHVAAPITREKPTLRSLLNTFRAP